MTNELKARISKAEASMAIVDRNTAQGQNLYNYYKDMIKTLTDKLPKPVIKLHVAVDSSCESCE